MTKTAEQSIASLTENTCTSNIAEPAVQPGQYLAGGTGGPGAAGSKQANNHPQHVSPFGKSDDDTMRHQYMHIVSSTGAMGARGSEPTAVEIEPDQPISAEVKAQAVDNLKEQVAKLTEKETLDELNRQSLVVDDVFAEARSKMLNVAYVQGTLLNHLEKLVLRRGDNWVEYIEKKMPNLKRKSREKYMKIAETPGILIHARMGIDRAEQVIQVIVPIRHMLDEKDPMGDLFKRNGAELDYANLDKLELRRLVKAVIEKERLAAKGIKVSLELVKEFHLLADKITPEDMAILVDRKSRGESPETYLLEVIQRNGVRGHGVATSKEKKPPVKYVNAESVKLAEGIRNLLAGTVDPSKVDTIHLEALQKAVAELIERCNATK